MSQHFQKDYWSRRKTWPQQKGNPPGRRRPLNGSKRYRRQQ